MIFLYSFHQKYVFPVVILNYYHSRTDLMVHSRLGPSLQGRLMYGYAFVNHHWNIAIQHSARYLGADSVYMLPLFISQIR